MRRLRRWFTGLLLVAFAGGWLMPIQARADGVKVFDTVNNAATGVQALLDLAEAIYCANQNQGNYWDLFTPNLSTDIMNALLAKLGPWGLAMEMTRDSASYLSNAAVESYLNSGESALEAQMSDFEQKNGFSSLSPGELTNFESYVEGIDFTTGQGASIADAALAAYGSMVDGVSPDNIAQWVADNRGNVNGNSQMLQQGLQIMILRDEQNNTQNWNDSSLASFTMNALGDVYGSASLLNDIYQTVLNSQCPPQPPVQASYDPNDISGTPAGAGAGHWVQGSTPLTFTIHFENEQTATASAVNVRVLATLDPNLDPTTVQPVGSSFAGTQFSFNPQTGQLAWSLPNINLPPDTSPPNGEGWVSFTAAPKTGLATGTHISESADVYFDYNPPITTPTLTYSVDTSPPGVTLTAPASSTTSSRVVLDWSGSSTAGMQGYEVYLSTDGGPFDLVDTTTSTSATLDLASGHSFGATIVAVDIAGLTSQGTPPTTAQASFQVTSPAQTGGSSGGGAAALPQQGGVGPDGGQLATADGLFQSSVPKGFVPSGATFGVTESGSLPAGLSALPSHTQVAGPYFTVAGAELNGPVTVTLTYDPIALDGLAADRVSVYEVTANGQWHFLPTALDQAADTASVSVQGPGTLVVVANTQKFSDVPALNWATPGIDRMLAAGVIGGFPDGTFRPAEPVTRAEFAKMLVLALGLGTTSGTTGFRDVGKNDWYAPYVAAALKADLIEGRSPTQFDPRGYVTREEMAVMLARALHLTSGATLTFHDAGLVGASSAQGVAAAVAAGYLEGFPDGTFRPAADATRAQVAKILSAVLTHLSP